MVVLNLVNTTGEFVLGKTVAEEARRAVLTEERQSAGAGEKSNLTSAQREKIVQAVIGKFYADFFFWVSLVGAVVQLFLVSRILKHVGVLGSTFLFAGHLPRRLFYDRLLSDSRLHPGSQNLRK